VNRDFPCKKCGHQALKHYISVGGGDPICFTCAEGGRTSWIEVNEHIHEFVGDNLKYMELVNKKEEIKNDQL